MAETAKVAYLGPEASFSHAAALKLFPNAKIVPEKSFQDIFRIVEEGKAEFGVVPIENSTEGSVNVNLDLLAEGELKIVKETSMKIEHQLVSKAGSLKEVKIVFSHPQGLAQCRQWLQKNLPEVELSESSSTAKAAESVAGIPNSAAISSLLAARKFGLNIIAENIQDNPNNQTRFVVISKKAAKPSGKVKTSILFSTKHKPGALFDALKALKDFGVNMTKIESRPSKKDAWHYVFFVDFEGSQESENVKKALEELGRHCDSLKILGSFEVI
ncbi:MAG TPA: prephenate dehydratase [Candidatus Diapherotrites archaeon]|uniref:prephenate dehydratase n=1 Tax=Candidatus Iainarchaeum sp. TaxID=3101447 RepID=A0A7J4KWG3_9ARCH|nr:prephenate dehydratase [Candidatus Diapherotrites archaeon]